MATEAMVNNEDVHLDAPVVYVLDDDPSVCKAIRRLVRSAGLDCQAFTAAEDFFAIPVLHRPCCLILDVRMPGLSGPEVQKEVKRREGGIPIIFLSGHATVPISVQAMKNGAVDFLTKPYDGEQLIEAVERALEKDARDRLVVRDRQTAQRRIGRLTLREFQVLRCVIAGLANNQIAGKLAISEKAVKVHRGRIMEKLEAGAVSDLVHIAERAGVTAVG